MLAAKLVEGRMLAMARASRNLIMFFRGFFMVFFWGFSGVFLGFFWGWFRGTLWMGL
jgi:hypothetical protein